jgi:hypothetical protein
MNRYDFTNLYQKLSVRKYYLVCKKCGFLHWDNVYPCPTPTQTSLDLKNGIRRDSEVIPAENLDRLWLGLTLGLPPANPNNPYMDIYP